VHRLVGRDHLVWIVVVDRPSHRQSLDERQFWARPVEPTHGSCYVLDPQTAAQK
jgi:hypothetical protein